jgi:hypothetical protein
LKWGNIVSVSSLEDSAEEVSAEEASLAEFDVVGDSGAWALATIGRSNISARGKKKNFTVHGGVERRFTILYCALLTIGK